MHNLKEIRKNFPAFEKSLEKRLIDIDFAKLKDLDIQNEVSNIDLEDNKIDKKEEKKDES